MTTVVFCKGGCNDEIERYEDDGPYIERYEVCDKCARDLREMEDEEARGEENERFDAPGCQMCGAHPEDPCDCHDPQGEENER